MEETEAVFTLRIDQRKMIRGNNQILNTGTADDKINQASVFSLVFIHYLGA